MATIRDSDPPIWRRIRMESGTTLAKLHKILQATFGWENAHLHQFVIGDVKYSAAREWSGEPAKVRDERQYALGDLVRDAQARFTYVYDFGDNWEHDLVVEKILPQGEEVSCPICLAGERAAPPEDVGGIGGYEEFLEALQKPDHPQHEDMKEWIGSTFDPEGFNLEAVNRKLRLFR